MYLNNHKQIYNNEQQFSISCIGIHILKCTGEEYNGNTIILHVQSKKRQKVCHKCGIFIVLQNTW